MVPVGVTPPVRVAVSLITPPTVTVAEAWVVSAGAALVTVTLSLASPHSVVAPPLLASPL